MQTQYYKVYFSYQHYVDNIKKLGPSAEIVCDELKGTVQRDGSGRNKAHFDKTFLKESSRRGFSKIRPSHID
jgi:hypothetical protein